MRRRLIIDDDMKYRLYTDGNWRVKVWADGTFEGWYRESGVSVSITAASGNVYRSEVKTLTLPAVLTDLGATSILDVSVNVVRSGYPVWTAVESVGTAAVGWYVLSGASRNVNSNHVVLGYVSGVVG